MESIKQIPKILIYEEFEGHPIYRKGYKDFITGKKEIEEINMGTSELQWFITNIINRKLMMSLPANYQFGSGELGLHVEKNTNFSADIAIYRGGQFQVGFHSTKYSKKPPAVVIEVDIKVDESDYFQNEEDYAYKKTEKMLKWGIERVIWVFSNSRRILVADTYQKWALVSWDIPVPIIDDLEINLWELMVANGFRVD